MEWLDIEPHLLLLIDPLFHAYAGNRKNFKSIFNLIDIHKNSYENLEQSYSFSFLELIIFLIYCKRTNIEQFKFNFYFEMIP